MSPIDEFQNDLKQMRLRPLSLSVIDAVEARLHESQPQQRTAVVRARTSRIVFAGVWSSGFAIGAAAMLLASAWLGKPPEQAIPSVTHTPPQAHDPPSSIAVVPDPTPAKTLVSYPVWTPRKRSYRHESEVLTVGSDIRTIFDRPFAPPSRHSLPGHETEFIPSDVTPDRYLSPAPTTRRELIDQILNEV